MEAPSQLKPALWGAVGGAVALAILGFTWGGWITGGKADVLARQQIQTALVEALTPICVDKFNRASDAQARLVELTDAETPAAPAMVQAVLPLFWFLIKVLFFLFLYIWVRGTLPRFRYDQLMAFGWKVLLPLAIANVLVTSFVVAVGS